MRTGALTGVAGFVAGFIVAMLLALAAGWVLFFRGGTGIDISQPTVIQHIQQLQRLETVVYSMEKIVTGAQNSAFLPQFLVGDRLTLADLAVASRGPVPGRGQFAPRQAAAREEGMRE